MQDYPEELEAKAFLALQIWLNSDKGLPISSHQAVDAVLSEVFAAEPFHPAHHYRIHLWDKEKPVRALESAARSAGRRHPRSRICGICRGIFIRGCIAMRTRPGNKRPRPASIMPT